MLQLKLFLPVFNTSNSIYTVELSYVAFQIFEIALNGAVRLLSYTLQVWPSIIRRLTESTIAALVGGKVWSGLQYLSCSGLSGMYITESGLGLSVGMCK